MGKIMGIVDKLDTEHELESNKMVGSLQQKEHPSC